MQANEVEYELRLRGELSSLLICRQTCAHLWQTQELLCLPI